MMKRIARKGEPAAWLRAHVDYAEGGCLIWPFGRTTKGYGAAFKDGQSVMAHKLMCEAAHGLSPSPELEVAHNCGKGQQGCVNPNHLRWATRSSNHMDKVAHGTDMRGTRNHKAKIDADSVREIRSLWGKAPRLEIAARFGLRPSTITNIQKRRIWAWLDAA